MGHNFNNVLTVGILPGEIGVDNRHRRVSNANLSTTAVVTLHAKAQGFVVESKLLLGRNDTHRAQKRFCDRRFGERFLGRKTADTLTLELRERCIQQTDRRLDVPTAVIDFFPSDATSRQVVEFSRSLNSRHALSRVRLLFAAPRPTSSSPRIGLCDKVDSCRRWLNE
jgi:hypothetical protein